jgi:hypothetical protein
MLTLDGEAQVCHSVGPVVRGRARRDRPIDRKPPSLPMLSTLQLLPMLRIDAKLPMLRSDAALATDSTLVALSRLQKLL